MEGLSLMFWALVVPELILTWAAKQWFAATAIEREFKQAHKWTKAHAHFLGMGGFTLAGRVGDGVSDVPKIPNLVVPIRPECPERPRGDREHFWQEMKQYWEDSARYRDSRRQFWANWERIQKDCSNYTYSADSRQTQRKLNDYDKEDYQRLERYGHSLPDRIAYLSETPGTLSFYRFRDLVDKEIIALPTITAEEINDRAKGDFFPKAIAIFHTTWFIVQFVARCIQNLAITQLEVVTLALAALNGITYFLWWDKPLGVLQPVIVYPRGVIPFERNEDNPSFLVTALHTFRTAPQRLSSISDSLRTSASAFLDDQLEEAKTSKWYQLPILVLRCLFYLPIASIIKSLFAIIDTSGIPPGPSCPGIPRNQRQFVQFGQTLHLLRLAIHLDRFRWTSFHWIELCVPYTYRADSLACIMF